MGRYRWVLLMSTALAGLAWATACGDGGTEPPPPDPPRPTTAMVSPGTVELVALGATAQLSAEVRDQNGQVMAGVTVTWASSATSVATVNASGLVTAAGNGTATITATAGGVSGTATVTVAQAVSAVVVSPAADTLVAGDTLRLAAAAQDANGHPVAGAEFSWASSDTLVAAVDDAGLVTGVGAGQAEITGRAQLTVVAPAPTTIAVTPDTVAFTALRQSEQLVAEVRDQAGRVMTGMAVSWSRADTTIATVSSAGRVTAAGIGATTVSATVGEISGTAVVTVEQSAGSVVVTPPADTVALGDTLRLVAEAFDENGHAVEGAEFTWSSSDVSVATVGGSGLVRGVAEGAATITATSGSAQGAAQITVDNPDRAALVALFRATDGPNWVNNENWLTDTPLGDWYGVDTDAAGRVVRMDLSGSYDFETQLPVVHGLSGPIPAELGNLGSLMILDLGYNDLSGRIPSELGNLANLTALRLWMNDLSGSIPPELSALDNLHYLILSRNSFTGPIPPELGGLDNLKGLYLGDNALTGAIPPELGNLANLEELYLASNELSGALPPELGNLATVEVLFLDHNDLEGPVPAELGRMSSLRELGLSYNGDMTGALPVELTSLRQLEALLAGGSGLCVPSDPAFQAWLARIHKRRITICAEGDPPMAYLTQAVQSREFPIPLVAGEKALLRVFPTARQATSLGIPAVRARFYVNGRETHVVDIPGKSTPIPTAVDESSLAKSANTEVPGHVLQPGLEMVIEVDPEGTLDDGLGVAKRIPETGRLAMDIRAMPLFDLTLIPFVWTRTNDESIVDLVGAIAADPENHELLQDTRTLMPVASTIAHELGHNMNLQHAPCGTTGDVSYPYTDGSIGVWGYDFRDGGSLVRPTRPDLMSYCGVDQWISDYSFTNALRYRLYDEGPPAAAAIAASSKSLLLWGGVDADSVPYLEPAFVADAPAALPGSAGEYRIIGNTSDGDELFSLSFAMPETADGDGSSSFAFVLPVRSGWEDSLATITLSGPGGSFTLDADSDLSVTILRNPRTGQVRGILRDVADPAAVQAAASAAGPGLEVLFSRGIPGAEAWRR